MKPLRALMAYLMTRASSRSRPIVWDELTVTLTDDAGIADANRRCFGRDHPTDVISQAYAALPGESGARGDIVVNVQRAAAATVRTNPDAELALYVAHGCDHLTGGRDDTPTGRARMLRRERRWLADARRAGGLAVGALFTPPRGRRP